MVNYEIMIIVSGSLDEKTAKLIANEIVSSIKEAKPKVEEYGIKKLAYKIKNDTHGYYFQYNFETEKTELINEFRRLCTINKNILRHMIINLNKDYGYRALVNEKKIKQNKIRAEIYARRKSEYEKMKNSREAEFANKKDIKMESKMLEEKINDDNKKDSIVKREPTVKKEIKKTVDKEEKKVKHKIVNGISTDQKHTIVSAAEFDDYNYQRRLKDWRKKAGYNEKPHQCFKCKEDDCYTSILLDNKKHICYTCWIKKTTTVSNNKTKTPSKK